MDKDMYEVMINLSENVDMLDLYYEKQKADNTTLKVLLQEEKEEKH